jgi:transposase
LLVESGHAVLEQQRRCLVASGMIAEQSVMGDRQVAAQGPRWQGYAMSEKLVNLGWDEREELERRYKRTHARRISERIQAILLLDDGRTRDQVAHIVQVNPKTITRWVQIYAQMGIEALCTLHYTGNAGALNAAQQHQLAVWLASRSRSTQEALVWVEQRFQIRYTESGMRKLLQRMSARARSPRAGPEVAMRVIGH